MRLLSLTTVLFVAFCGWSQPNRFRFHTYGQDEGLSSSSVNVMAEDSYGFIWIGTEDGLFRFDAHQFIAYRKTQNTHPALPSNSITALYPLQNGHLMVGTREGLAYFDTKTEQFTNLWKDQEPVYICKILPNGEGKYWIATRDGLYRYNSQNQEFTHWYQHDPNDNSSISYSGLVDAIIDSKGRLWISTFDGLNLYQKETDNFKRYRNDESDHRSISSNVLRKLSEAPDGNILVGTASNGLNVLDPQTNLFQRYSHEPGNPFSLSATSVYSLLVDSRENVWVGTWSNGLNLFDLDAGKSMRYIYDPNKRFSIPHNSIKFLMESSSGDIWLGTDDAGIARLSPSEEEVVRYQTDSKNENALKTDYVRTVHEDETGIVWIGTAQNGLHKYDRDTEKFEYYLLPDGSRRSKSRSTIWSISEGEDDILWLGTSIGLGKFSKRSGKTTFFEPDDDLDNSISTNDILDVLYDGKGNVWAGTWSGGLNRLDIERGEFEVFLHDSTDPNSLAANTVSRLYQDKKGRIWLISDGLLHLLNADQRSFTRFEVSTNSIAEDESGDLLLASNEGLIKFNTQELIYERLAVGTTGMLDDSFYAIEIDTQGKVWLGSEHGIVCYDPIGEEIVGQFDKSSGLAGNNISSKVSDIGEKSGKLYFGGIQGLSEIDPELLSLKPFSPPIVITNFLLFNKRVPINDSTQLPQSIHTSQKVSLNYDDYIFAFEFASLSFSQHEKVRYAYQLEGFDDNWITTDYLDRKAVYTNVPPGNYTFKVKNTNHQGVWLEDKMASIEVIIIPPWWQTWWARTLLYILILITVFFIFRMRLELIKKQKRMLEQQVQERSSEVLKQKQELEIQASQLIKVNDQKNKLFSIIAHDLKTPINTLMSVVPLIDPKILQADNLEKIKQDLSERVGMLSTAMEDLLMWAKSQMEGEVINKMDVSMLKLASEMYELFYPYAFSKEIALINGVNTDICIHVDENQMRAILRNLLSNAIKFTGKGGEVAIRTTVEDSKVVISVSDTGVGIPSEEVDELFELRARASQGTKGEQGVGLGLIVVKEFVDKNGGIITVEKNTGEGTTFKVTLDCGDGYG